MGRGKFISFEGIEGVGKSTNIDVLVKCIEASGRQVLTTREPGGTPLAEEIRELLVGHGEEQMSEIAELLLVFAARSQHVNNVILPALEAGKWVVCDRFSDSSRAYQGGGRGIPMDTIDRLADWVHGDTWPDLTILLDAPVEVGMERANKRGAPDRFEREQHDFFERARECYLQLANAEPGRFTVIDANRNLADVRADIVLLAEKLIASS
ncbi:MAG: dTMP kinase [Proteobacteria bacterium]|nr:dTMP kinase [Pseudomonadota bacterium]